MKNVHSNNRERPAGGDPRAIHQGSGPDPGMRGDARNGRRPFRLF